MEHHTFIVLHLQPKNASICISAESEIEVKWKRTASTICDSRSCARICLTFSVSYCVRWCNWFWTYYHYTIKKSKLFELPAVRACYRFHELPDFMFALPFKSRDLDDFSCVEASRISLLSHFKSFVPCLAVYWMLLVLMNCKNIHCIGCKHAQHTWHWFELIKSHVSFITTVILLWIS